MRDPRHDILFEPLSIGPVTTANRFYQVPHCSGMGWRRPQMLAAMRGIKAEGGWGVVNTEYCSVHPTSDNDAFPFAALWDDGDIRAHRLMTDAVHEHGALAGVELWLGGGMVMNLATRLPPLGLRNRPQTDSGVFHPGQTRKIDRDDIRDIRRWHRDAARRAVDAGFDIIYVYATHGYLLSEFLDADVNDRTDEYGGSLENRVRIVRELIEDTREATGGRIAVATRFSVDLADPETYDAFGLLADLPDLWDLTVPDYGIEMGTSRFVKEAALVDSIGRAKSLTSKPVVAVGRFTSPDTMAQALRAGHQDLIGAARPSIADPFLPRKIEEGRYDDIRECIGCNICYAHDSSGVPLRCTQNPTMGEEWRLGWHPERAGRTEKPARVLVVGAGPAGLEAARVLGERGHAVMLAEVGRDLGGRVRREARLPGLGEWLRVRDWRLGQIEKLASVEIFRESLMAASDISDLGADHILIATGAKWATDTIGRHSATGLTREAPGMVASAETILNHQHVDADHVVIYDDDHYYMGTVLALHLRQAGHRVTLVTPAGRPCEYGVFTGEIHSSNAALVEAGVDIITNRMITAVEPGRAEMECVFAGRRSSLDCDLVIPVCRRLPVTTLYDGLRALMDGPAAAGIRSVRRIGDAEAPGTIAAAVYSGHRAAMELGCEVDSTRIYGRRDR
ncbi:MAG: FAD-dependent oxidoreductase [Rhodobacteraceae bacterium]|nr:FAD-dependent oxidoreductase [Paracoccaceae bacterium]MCP5342557.1 FAD-dependent oxidoreductase [Paracoccaceae bacterium]